MLTDGDVVKLKPEAQGMIGALAEQLVFPCIVVNVYTTSAGEQIAQCLTRYKYDTNKIYHLRNWNVDYLESIK